MVHATTIRVLNQTVRHRAIDETKAHTSLHIPQAVTLIAINISKVPLRYDTDHNGELSVYDH